MNFRCSQRSRDESTANAQYVEGIIWTRTARNRGKKAWDINVFFSNIEFLTGPRISSLVQTTEDTGDDDSDDVDEDYNDLAYDFVEARREIYESDDDMEEENAIPQPILESPWPE